MIDKRSIMARLCCFAAMLRSLVSRDRHDTRTQTIQGIANSDKSEPLLTPSTVKLHLQAHLAEIRLIIYDYLLPDDPDAPSLRYSTIVIWRGSDGTRPLPRSCAMVCRPNEIRLCHLRTTQRARTSILGSQERDSISPARCFSHCESRAHVYIIPLFHHPDLLDLTNTIKTHASLAHRQHVSITAKPGWFLVQPTVWPLVWPLSGLIVWHLSGLIVWPLSSLLVD